MFEKTEIQPFSEFGLIGCTNDGFSLFLPSGGSGRLGECYYSIRNKEAMK